MAVYYQKSEKEDAVHLGVETPAGTGFLSVPAGKRDLIRYAGTAALAALSLVGHVRAQKKNSARVRRARQKTIAQQTRRVRRSGRFGR